MIVDSLLLQERHAFILECLQVDGRVLAPDLAARLKVSEDTIRRDLRDLAAAGLCQKVYGGALRSAAPVPPAPNDGTLGQRRGHRVAAKSQLALAAATLIRPGMVLFIDAGSTNLGIAAALPEVALTVVTNAPAIAAALVDRAQVELIVVGGRVDRAAGASFGAAALRDIDMLRPDLFCLGACGVDAAAGITAFQYEEALFKRRVAEASKAVLVAATGDKLATAAPYQVLAAARLTHLVVEHDADRAWTDAYADLGTLVLRAAAPTPHSTPH
ncbi:DeoR/GlpR family DNA-binding transcription regulator [Rugamonas sp.]|uniref:DeoR/GlpR family DNA-binding transcription regulator n=1 Tax=Rugamonas sp. TaxID=1926287 RepID=UPI0025DF1C74|nr:DeoR/GlpR family DNA-binding transcription regulator [Rugamonas sp.]